MKKQLKLYKELYYLGYNGDEVSVISNKKSANIIIDDIVITVSMNKKLKLPYYTYGLAYRTHSLYTSNHYNNGLYIIL